MNNRAFRDSFLAAQKMKDFERESYEKKHGIKWWFDYAIPAFAFIALLAMIAGVISAAWFIFRVVLG